MTGIGDGSIRWWWRPAAVAEESQRLREIECPKINLQVMPGNKEAVALYRKLGYKIEERISMAKPLV